MKNYIKECTQMMKDEYSNNYKRIRSDYNREREAIEVYKGRELLELIQNADDELLDGMGKEIRLSFIDKVLTISNNGSPFSKDGIDSLMYSNHSAKSKKNDVIGNKGTGFRAILGWANEIKISSGELEIRFSDEYAQSVLQEILNENRDSKANEEYIAATLVFPEWTESNIKSEYTTDISISINDDEKIINDINQQLEDIDGKLLLFLNRAEELYIEAEEQTICFVKKILDENSILINKYIDDILEESQEWILSRKNGEINGKQFSIVIAYNSEGLEKDRQVVYSYFPTDVEFPFPVLLHANFNLNSDRNHLTKKNEENGYILEQACKLLIETAIRLTENEVSYDPLLILSPQRSVPKELNDYQFEGILLEEIKQSKVFPTVNSRYVDFNSNPKFYDSQLSKFLDGDEFEDLLINTENEIICSLIRRLNNGVYPIYSFDEIVKKINRWSKSNEVTLSSIEKNAHCAIELLDDYSIEMRSNKKMPKLIYDSENRLVSNEKLIFLSDKNANISVPPRFAQIQFMNLDMRNKFEELIGSIGRNIANYLRVYGVREYNTARIIEKMNSIIKKDLDKGKTEIAMRRCQLEIKWMWENRTLLEAGGEKIRIYFITRNGEIRLSDELYMGKEYGNLICENLFDDLYEHKFIDDIRKYIDDTEPSNQEIMTFLQTLGVDLYPKHIVKSIRPNNEYKSKIFGLLQFPYTLEWTDFKNLNDICNRVHDKIANTYNLIEMPKRQSSSRIKRLLGVSRLNISGVIVGNPSVHSENIMFQRDFRLYKPLAFCYRIDNATKDEMKRFSQLNIVLCTDLSARYTDKVIDLDDYDFILQDSKTFYLKVPSSIRTLIDMKESVFFAAAIANILCSFIDVSEPFASFRELYGASEVTRIQLIHQIFEDDDIIERSKNELNYLEDTKEEFVRIILKHSDYSYEEINKIAKDIDYYNLSSISNARAIINCFKQLNIDVEVYNSEMPSTEIDLTNYFNAELDNLLLKYENSYKTNQYKRMKTKTIAEKKKLVESFLNYDNMKPTIINSIYYDSEMELVKFLELEMELEDIDFVSLYNNNLNVWENNLQNKDLIAEFLNNTANMSCIYYEEYELLNKSYNEFIASQLLNDNSFNNIGQTIEPEIIYPQTTANGQSVTRNNNMRNKTTGFSSPKNLEKIGLMGEKIVYETLKKDYTKLKWMSENAKSEGINPEGRAGLGYDIEYLDEAGKRIFIEVKASKTNEITFHMSENEFDFALKHLSEYKIFYVSEVLSKKPKIYVLDNVFKDNDFNFGNYFLETTKGYKIMASIDK